LGKIEIGTIGLSFVIQSLIDNERNKRAVRQDQATTVRWGRSAALIYLLLLIRIPAKVNEIHVNLSLAGVKWKERTISCTLEVMVVENEFEVKVSDN